MEVVVIPTVLSYDMSGLCFCIYHFFLFEQITPGWNGTTLKPNSQFTYSKVYYMFRSMYQQQVGPEHGYTTYIMRSLRSPPAHKVSKQLGKIEIKKKIKTFNI